MVEPGRPFDQVGPPEKTSREFQDRRSNPAPGRSGRHPAVSIALDGKAEWAMRFWDSSALVPLLVREENTEALLDLIPADRDMVVWWGTETECLSALARREREGGLDRRAVSHAEESLSKILGAAHEVQPNTELRRMARRLLMTHPLRAADALQLASALFFGGSQISELPLITLDKNLSVAAAKEGFPLPASNWILQ